MKSFFSKLILTNKKLVTDFGATSQLLPLFIIVNTDDGKALIDLVGPHPYSTFEKL